MSTQPPLPLGNKRSEIIPGHWLLARLGKKILRPGGIELTRELLKNLKIKNKVVVEFAPGLGYTASEIVEYQPSSYIGIEQDKDAGNITQGKIESHGKVINKTADDTGLENQFADVVIGEAMLSMHSDEKKSKIISEASRILKLNGLYAIHELEMIPEDIDETKKQAIRRELIDSIKVNATPLTLKEWSDLLVTEGFEIVQILHKPMTLLEPARMITDEGILGFLKILKNALLDSDARKRVLGMRSVFRQNAHHLGAIGIIAKKIA